MNDNKTNFEENGKNVYRATSNLNTAIENPQINMNSAVGVNIKDVDSSNFANDGTFSGEENYNMPNALDNNISNDFNNHDSNMVANNSSFEESKMKDNDFNFQDNLGQNLSNNYTSPQINNSSFIKNDDSSSSVDSNTFRDNFNTETNYVATSGNEHVVYEPTMKEKKKRSVSFTITRELKVILFIIFILLIFILVIPYIYDFFKELQLVITTR